jgi:hypothetical protein
MHLRATPVFIRGCELLRYVELCVPLPALSEVEGVPCGEFFSFK